MLKFDDYFFSIQATENQKRELTHKQTFLLTKTRVVGGFLTKVET